MWSLILWLRGVLRLSVVALACAMISCRSARLAEVPGKYAVEVSGGTSTLILRADGTMEQLVPAKGGESERVSGTWTFEDGFLARKPCLVIRWEAESSRADRCVSAVEVPAFGRVEISLDTDHGIAYKKLNDRP